MIRLYVCAFSVLFISMLSIPLIAVTPNTAAVSSSVDFVQKVSIKSDSQSQKATEKNDMSNIKVKLYIKEDKKVKTITKQEYLIGVLCGEIDADYSIEAIKSQVVAANTFLQYKSLQNKDKSYDITNSPETDQCYLTKNQRQNKCGDNFSNDEALFLKAVNAVGDKVITYKSKPIFAAYHAISGGKTESAENVWGSDYKYLQSVESISDVLSDDYVSSVTYTVQEFKSLSESIGINLGKRVEKYIGKITTSSVGTVLKCTIGSKTFSGQKIRETFNLRSANFDLQLNDNKFVFTVRGFGHCVGMSQYGANFMAKNGSSYKQILDWYYTDCKISG